jgi:hypothetical protein
VSSQKTWGGRTAAHRKAWKGTRNLTVLEFELLVVLRVEVSLLFSDWLEDEACDRRRKDIHYSRPVVDDDWIIRKSV